MARYLSLTWHAHLVSPCVSCPSWSSSSPPVLPNLFLPCFCPFNSLLNQCKQHIFIVYRKIVPQEERTQKCEESLVRSGTRYVLPGQTSMISSPNKASLSMNNLCKYELIDGNPLMGWATSGSSHLLIAPVVGEYTLNTRTLGEYFVWNSQKCQVSKEWWAPFPSLLLVIENSGLTSFITQQAFQWRDWDTNPAPKPLTYNKYCLQDVLG